MPAILISGSSKDQKCKNWLQCNVGAACVCPDVVIREIVLIQFDDFCAPSYLLQRDPDSGNRRLFGGRDLDTRVTPWFWPGFWPVGVFWSLVLAWRTFRQMPSGKHSDVNLFRCRSERSIHFYNYCGSFPFIIEFSSSSWRRLVSWPCIERGVANGELDKYGLYV